MIFRRVITSRTYLFTIVAFLFMITLPSSAHQPGDIDRCICPGYIFSPGSISTGTGTEEKKIEFSGRLLAYFCSGKNIYYLSGDMSDEEESDSTEGRSYRLGFFSPGEGEEDKELKTEILLQPGGGNPFRIFARGVNVFILNGAGILYHINLNSMVVSRRENVSDAALSGMTLVLLEGEGDKLNINGKYLPLTITGKSRIGGIIDNRLLFLSNDRETEVVDLVAGESIYQYSSEETYAVSDEYNLVISAYEEDPESSRPGTRSMVFYKVFIDGIESGRTETGVSGSEKFLRTSVTPGGYHLVRLERWELSVKRNRYRRANNIYQPKKIRIYIPQKRIIKLEVKYDGREYGYRKQAVKKVR
jgi:hypothetical protein